MTVQPAPGVVLAVWTSDGIAERLIRAGEALMGQPAVANHVIGLTHQDKLGRWIGLQGQPGGVGMTDATPYLASRHTRGNYGQVQGFTQADVTGLLADAAKTIGIRYDWFGIAEDDLDALGAADLTAEIDRLWRWGDPHGRLPGEVVCSSLWAMLYERRGLAHPDLGAERTCTPGGWWDWNDGELWARG